MFSLLLGLLLIGAAIHGWTRTDRSMQAMGRTFLDWLLVGYCGVPMIAVAIGVLAGFDLRGGAPRELFSAEIGLQFAAVALFAMAVSTLVAVYYRGQALSVAAIGWAVYWLGATLVHFNADSEGLNMGHGNIAMIFIAHGLVGVLLAIALWASGEWRKT